MAGLHDFVDLLVESKQTVYLGVALLVIGFAVWAICDYYLDMPWLKYCVSWPLVIMGGLLIMLHHLPRKPIYPCEALATLGYLIETGRIDFVREFLTRHLASLRSLYAMVRQRSPNLTPVEAAEETLSLLAGFALLRKIARELKREEQLVKAMKQELGIEPDPKLVKQFAMYWEELRKAYRKGKIMREDLDRFAMLGYRYFNALIGAPF